MTKRILILAAAAVVAISFKSMKAEVPLSNFEGESHRTASANSVSSQPASTVAEFATQVYQQLDFSAGETLKPAVFEKAVHGYLALKEANKLGDKSNILSVCDFSLASSHRRLWIIDMAQKKVLLNDLVAHGAGSGEEMATAFSNTDNSHQSSLGFYVTGDTYQGEHGNSLRLLGMDKGFNCAALARGIVVHGASYVNKAYAAANKRIGRSWGCPAVNDAIAQKVIGMTKGGSCMFIYAGDKAYDRTAYWVNKSVKALPTTPQFAHPAMMAMKDSTVELVPAPSHRL
jgi:hypothetical protein